MQKGWRHIKNQLPGITTPELKWKFSTWTPSFEEKEIVRVEKALGLNWEGTFKVIKEVTSRTYILVGVGGKHLTCP